MHRTTQHALAILVSASMLGGCTSTNTIPTRKLAALKADGAGVVYTEDGEAIRIDPNSKLRFVRRDGSVTPWTEARELYVNDDGFYIQRFYALSSVEGARVEGLGPNEATALKATAPSEDMLLDEGNGAFQILATGPAFASWFFAFRRAVAARHPATEAEVRSHESVCASADAASSNWCKATDEERALDRLERTLGGEPLGKWTFRLDHADWVGPYEKASLVRVCHKGIEALDGLKWGDVASAEIENFSGGKTLVAVVGITAAAVGLVAVAMVARKMPMPNLGGQAAGAIIHTTARATQVMIHVAAHSHPHVSGGGGSSTSSEGPSPSNKTATDYGSDGDDGSSTLWKPGYELPDTDKGGQRIFGGVARRRSIVRVVAAADLAAGPFGPRAPWSSGVIPTLRFNDFFEIGGGVRFIGRGVGMHSDLVKLFRIGMHAELDAHRRFAFPLMIDVGAGGDVALHVRFAWGLRIRATEHLSFGLYALNPTYTRYRSPTTDAGSGPAMEVPRWTFPSGIETTFVF